MKRCLFSFAFFIFLFSLFLITTPRFYAQEVIFRPVEEGIAEQHPADYPDAGGDYALPPCGEGPDDRPCPPPPVTFPDSGGDTVWVPTFPDDGGGVGVPPGDPVLPPPPVPETPPTMVPELPEATIPLPPNHPMVSLEGSGGGCSMVANAAGVGYTIPAMIFGIFAAVTCFRVRRSK